MPVPLRKTPSLDSLTRNTKTSAQHHLRISVLSVHTLRDTWQQVHATSATWHIGMTWRILMRRYATAFGAVGQDEPCHGNKEFNPWMILRLPCADGLPPSMPPRLGGQSSLYGWRDSYGIAHLLCLALGDRKGPSKN